MRLTGKQTWVFQNDIYVNATGTAVGPKEVKALLERNLIFHMMIYIAERKNWELAERRVMSDSIQQVMQKANVETSQIDFFLAGDLLNQTVTANYVARKWGIPFLGMFSCLCDLDGDFSGRISLYRWWIRKSCFSDGK